MDARIHEFAYQIRCQAAPPGFKTLPVAVSAVIGVSKRRQTFRRMPRRLAPAAESDSVPTFGKDSTRSVAALSGYRGRKPCMHGAAFRLQLSALSIMEWDPAGSVSSRGSIISPIILWGAQINSGSGESVSIMSAIKVWSLTKISNCYKFILTLVGFDDIIGM